MNHQVEAHIQAASETKGSMGRHMSASVSVVVPLTASFGGPPKELKVDCSKVTVIKKS